MKTEIFPSIFIYHRYKRITYKEMVNAMMTEVRAVKKVSAHFTITPVYLHYRLTA